MSHVQEQHERARGQRVRGGVDWAAEPSRSGEPTLRIGDRWVHSRYAPRREAADFARRTRQGLAGPRQPVVLVGTGLGYVPEALSEAVGGEILAWDPFPEIGSRLPEGAPAPDWRERVRVATRLDELEAELGRALGPGRLPHVVVHPGYAELCRFETRWLTRRLRTLAGAGAPQTRVRDAVVSRRSLDSLVRLPRRRDVTELDGVCAGRTAVCVAPGPSLDDAALAVLARRQGGVVVAALQALRRLQEAGVRVDLVVASDPHDMTRHLEGTTDDFGALLLDTSVRPDLLDRWPEKTVLFHLRTPHLHGVAWERAGLPVIDEPVMTVAETSLCLAHQLGAARFALVGVDLCGEADRYAQHRLRTTDARGAEVVTNTHYLAASRYLSWRCPRLEAEGRPVLRLGRGLPVAGTVPGDPEALAAWLDEETPPELPPADFAGSRERWRTARAVLQRAARVRAVPRGPVAHQGEREAARRFEDLQPLEPPERNRALAQALQDLGPEPTGFRPEPTTFQPEPTTFRPEPAAPAARGR